jgi:orotate phosphoribosyltransferase
MQEKPCEEYEDGNRKQVYYGRHWSITPRPDYNREIASNPIPAQIMAQTSNKREQLVRLLAERSVKRGSFILASGQTSQIYVDARLTTMSPEGLTIIGTLALEEIDHAGWKMDSVGGLTLGADPIAYAIAYASAGSQHPVRAFTVRKEEKAHGMRNLIEGPFSPGDQVVIVDDVVTTGSSTIRAIDAVVLSGGVVQGVLTVLDREEGGREAIQSHGYEIRALCKLSEL